MVYLGLRLIYHFEVKQIVVKTSRGVLISTVTNTRSLDTFDFTPKSIFLNQLNLKKKNNIINLKIINKEMYFLTSDSKFEIKTTEPPILRRFNIKVGKIKGFLRLFFFFRHWIFVNNL